jgi:hypothetical protein
MYTIDSTKIPGKVHDVAKEYKDAKKKYPHAMEKEYAVEKQIPWGAVTGIKEMKGKKGEWKDYTMPKKREIEFQA